MIKVRMTSPGDVDKLMNAAEYEDYVKTAAE